MSGGPKQTLQQGYEKFVVKNKDGCWGWAGCAPKNPGYGQFRFGMKTERAHRASWIIHNGPIPEGMCVLHKCDNPICSNPQHLFLGTIKDNNLDMLNKGYHPTLGKTGEKNPMAKLTNGLVKEIKKLINSELSQHTIAKLFGVAPMTICRIKNNKTWKELQ